MQLQDDALGFSVQLTVTLQWVRLGNKVQLHYDEFGYKVQFIVVFEVLLQWV